VTASAGYDAKPIESVGAERIRQVAAHLNTRHMGGDQRKHDGDRYLTGSVRYTADIDLPGMARVHIVRSPHAHARITDIDGSAAMESPGVLAVLTGEQAATLAGPIIPMMDTVPLGGHNAPVRCLALDKVVYAGQPVVAVVAESEAEAAFAARAVRVTYEVLPAVLTATDALAEDAPLLHEEWGDNVLFASSFGLGDFDAVAQTADGVVEGELRSGRSSPTPMELRCYIGDWDSRAGHLTWYGTSQNPHPQRLVLATALSLPEHMIRVITPPAGGSFGLKMHGHPEEVLVAVLSRLVGRPVKWAETRAECLLQGGREHLQRYRAAFADDGRVHALHVELVADHGAVGAGSGWGMSFVGAMTFPTGYDIQQCTVDYTIAVTNKPPQVGMKPFGKDIAVMCMERVMDLVAEATGLEPVEVRRRNWIKSSQFPYRASSGLVLDSGDYLAVMDQALELINYEELRQEQRAARAAGRYVGIGIGFEMLPEGADIPASLVNAYDSATVRMDPSGHVTVLTGATSPGGGNETAFAQIAADYLGVGPAEITVVQGDTELCPYGIGNISSRGLVVGGSAVALAAEDVRAKLVAVAAGMLSVDRSDVVLADGLARSATDPSKMLPLQAVAHGAYTLNYVFAPDIDPSLESTRTYKMPNVQHIPDEHGRLSTYTSFSNGVYITMVEVDIDTGIVKICDHAMVHDCGTQMNPAFVEGQVRGGVVMGLGAALGEEVVFDGDGHLVSDGLKHHLLRRAADLPRLAMGHLETPSPYSLFGAKGVGESGFSAAAAALLGAVNDALAPVGARIDDLPITPPRLLRTILKARS
jgi:carbon-monoxide dehydrogenase large subunit